MPIEINEELYIGNARQLTSSNIKNLKVNYSACTILFVQIGLSSWYGLSCLYNSREPV